MAMTELSADDPALASYADVDSDEPHKGDLLEQFYLTLTVMYLGAPAGANSVVHERIERLFKSQHSWRNAYEIEQLLCFILSEQQLQTELDRRLAEARALKMEFVDVIAKELQDPAKPVDKRILLHRLLNDMQWFYSKRVHHRSASKRLMLRVSLLFMVALVTLFLVLFIQFFAHQAPRSANGQVAAAGPGAAASPTTASPEASSEAEKPGGDK
ncbi:MAG TPA: hypothetical protein VFS23_32020 [Vicinamibacterales bacterium]|nr:hypothetical protein [Vicinamibacterales bacterium]